MRYSCLINNVLSLVRVCGWAHYFYSFVRRLNGKIMLCHCVGRVGGSIISDFFVGKVNGPVKSCFCVGRVGVPFIICLPYLYSANDVISVGRRGEQAIITCLHY